VHNELGRWFKSSLTRLTLNKEHLMTNIYNPKNHYLKKAQDLGKTAITVLGMILVTSFLGFLSETGYYSGYAILIVLEVITYYILNRKQTKAYKQYTEF
jgi:hypothetical protein